MHDYSPELRQAYADQLCQMIRGWLVDDALPFELDLERGVEWCPDVAGGDRIPRQNRSTTLTLRIDGGAHESQGPPIVRNPPVFRGPERSG